MAIRLVKNRPLAIGPTLKPYLLKIIRILIPLAILGWLLHKESASIRSLVTRPKDLWLLSASFTCLLMATSLSFLRWFLLVRALNIPFAIRDAFRISFLGYLFNFVGPTAVGGDLCKAYLLVRNHRERRAEAVATILLDRLVGVYSLFIVATVGIAFLGGSRLRELGDYLQIVSLLTLAGTAVIWLLLMPRHFSDWFFRPLAAIPRLGQWILRIQAAIELYRRRRIWLLAIGLLSLGVHLLIALSIRFADQGIHPLTPTLTEHFIISPLAGLAGAAPVPGGLGTFELAMDYLYETLPSRTLERGQGLSVAVVYRLFTIFIACVGIGFYLLNRRTVLEVVSEIESGRQVSQATPARRAESV